MFYEDYMNFTFFCYFRQCGVIPIQSFESHIRPQPSGLGITHYICSGIMVIII